MQQVQTWLLPEGIEEILPKEARELELLRSSLLRLFESWGYEMVIPPMIDFIDSLLTGSGHDLDLQTFKITDQISGKSLGFRADMTPQVARMDAHQLRREWPTRLCYVGTVLHTRGDPLEKTRSPMQIGAELYGHDGIESDVEVISLMLEMLAISGIMNTHLDLGHVGIFRALSRQAGLNKTTEAALFDILQRKAKSELVQFLSELKLDKAVEEMFLKLPELNGNKEILNEATHVFAKADEPIKLALLSLQNIAAKLSSRLPNLEISFDLTELRGYHYHTGVVFSAFVPTMGKEIARGGRYDNIGSVFGRARPATGFSADLKTLTTLGKDSHVEQAVPRIFAPDADDIELMMMIRELRAQGQIVIQQLSNQVGCAKEMGCNAILKHVDKHWIVINITE